MKKIGLIFMFIIIFIIIYIQHVLVFDSRNKSYFGFSGFNKYFSQNYINYFFNKNEDPIYVWKDKVFSDYINDCHNNKNNCLVLPHQQMYSDIVWMNSIQYVGSVIESSKTPYLYSMLDNITNLNPYWLYPYIFGELLLPVNKNLMKNVDSDYKQQSWIYSVSIGEKGIKYNCENNKVGQINQLSGDMFYKIITNKSDSWNHLKNPCTNYEIPWYLGFNYYYYLSNSQKSSLSYQIASFNEDAPKMVSSMVAVVLGRLGQHVQSMGLWFSQYSSFYDKIQNSHNQEEIDLYTNKLQEAEKKSLFEFQLSIIETASNTYGKNDCTKNYKCLLEKGFIKQVLIDTSKVCQNYLPKDFEGDNLFKVNNGSTQFQEKIKCFLMVYGYKSGYIKDDGSLIYPFNSETDKFRFNFDEDLNDWWIELDR